MTHAEAAKTVVLLQAAYPGARWNEATADIYETLLADLDFETARTAIKRIACTVKFMPSIAEIREAVADIVLGPCRHPIDAWGDVVIALEWAQRIGNPTRPKFNDLFVAECVETLGWRDLGNEPADRARFCELYQDLQRKQRARDLSEPGRLQLGGASGVPRLPPKPRELRDVGELPQRYEPPREDPDLVRDPAEIARLLDGVLAKLG